MRLRWSARLRDGSVRFIGRGGPCRWVRRPGRSARGHAARRGGRHGSIPYAGIDDDSEVVRNRPIKCRDDIHSISHYLPRPATGGEAVIRDDLPIREILTAGALRTHAGGDRCDASGCGDAVRAMQGAMHRITRNEMGRYVPGCRRLGARRKPSSGPNGLMRRTENRWHSPILRTRIQTRQAVGAGSGEIRRGGKLPARRSGVWQ